MAKITITPIQSKILNDLQYKNEHTEVRIMLAEIFNAPKYIIKRFNDIKKRSTLSLSYDDFMLRWQTTQKLNNFIKNNYGKKMMELAISFQ